MKIRGLYPVHPKLNKIHGLTCYPSLKDLPEIPEVVVFAVSFERTVGIFEEFCKMGGKGAIIFSDGFAEMGRNGLKEKLVELSELYKVAFSHEAFKACCEQAGFYLVEEVTEDPKIMVNVLCSKELLWSRFFASTLCVGCFLVKHNGNVFIKY